MNKLLVIIILILAIGGFSVKAEGNDESASLYLSPSSGTFYVGSTFDVSVFVNTENASINAVRADLSFSPNLLQVTSPTAGSSFISIWADQPFYSNRDGIISFKGGLPSPGINTSAGLVSTITFRVKAPGIANISFMSASQVLSADGQGSDILRTSTGGKYILSLPPPEGPEIFSTSHSCLTCWYKNNNPNFFWEKGLGITDFSFSLDNDARAIPDNVSEGSLTSVTFSDLLDGIWYFHIKAKKRGIWGGTTHYAVQIDNTPPRDFTIDIERTGARFFSYFSTNDLLSKIDHYEVSTVDMSNPQEILNPFFIEADNLYQIPYESPGKYVIIVRAYDKAGNYTESKQVLTIVSPLISYTEKGIRLKGLFLPWWLVWFSLLLPFIGLGVAFYRLWQRKNLFGGLKKEVAEAEKEIEDVKKMEEKISKMRVLEEEAKKESQRLIEKLTDKKDE